MGGSGVCTLTGQTSTGEEGDPTASASPTDGTREAPWMVRPLTHLAVKPAHVQGGEEVGGSEGPPVIGGIGPPVGVERPNLKGCGLPTGRVGREGRRAMGNAVRTVGPFTAPNDRGCPPTAWHQIDWRTAERSVQSLRSRIFRAAKEQRWKQVRNRTKLLLRSYANRLVSVPAYHPGESREAYARDRRGMRDHA